MSKFLSLEMYLLNRKIEAYYDYDQILSITDSVDTANRLKQEYIEKILQNDPFRKQVYHSVNLEKDIVFEDITAFINGRDTTASNFFLVCHLQDSLGICSLSILKIFTNSKEAENYKTKFYEYLEVQQQHTDDFESEIGTERNIQDVPDKLDLTVANDYFDGWAGELKIIRITKNKLKLKDLKITLSTRPLITYKDERFEKGIWNTIGILNHADAIKKIEEIEWARLAEELKKIVIENKELTIYKLSEPGLNLHNQETESELYVGLFGEDFFDVSLTTFKEEEMINLEIS